MKNITVSVPDNVYREARIKAAERDTSVSALVREFLVGLGHLAADFERRKRLQQDVLRTVEVFRGSDRLSREDAHNRHALR